MFLDINFFISVPDLDPHPDPKDPYVFWVFSIRIRINNLFFKIKENLDFYCFVTSL
jgi:hypothetical protein